MYHAIVFLPLIGFLIAGGFGRRIGVRASELVTTSFLFVAALLSWIAFFRVGLGAGATRVQVANWMTSGDLVVDWTFRIDTLTVVMLIVVTTVSALVHLYSMGYMHEDPHRPRFFGFLSLFTFAMLMLVTADNLVQMFFGWEGVGLQGVHRQPGGRFRLRARHLPGLRAVRKRGLRPDLPPGRRARGSAFPLHRLRLACPDARVPAALYGRDGQVGAVSPAYVVARRHGGPHSGFRAHPRRHDGDGGGVHGGPSFAALRIRPGRPVRRHRDRRDHGVLRGHRRPGAERHQAGDRLLDLLAARLHVRRPRRRGLFGRHLPPLHPRLLQGPALPRRGLGDPRHAPRAGHAEHGRPAPLDSDHGRDDGGGDPCPDGFPVYGGLLLQGCHHRGRVRLAPARRGLRIPRDRDRRIPDGLLFVAPILHDLRAEAALGGRRRPRDRRP